VEKAKIHRTPNLFIQSHYILFLFKIQLIFAFFDGKTKLKKIQIVTILTCVQYAPKGKKPIPRYPKEWSTFLA
jgi:hypothetical protein